MTWSQERQALSDFIRERISNLLATPRMWGSPEAVEMQFLQLLEILMAVEAPSYIKANPRLVIDSYDKFIQCRFPDTKRPLSALLKNDPDAKLLCGYLKEYFTFCHKPEW